ncbi:MAG: sodium:calcium antiporter [Promethearchaeota archaeon]
MIIHPVVDTIILLIIMSIAAELIARGAEILGKKFGAGFVGAVLLGFITTLPELVFVVVAISAAQQAQQVTEGYNIAMGSAIGGNLLLFTIGYGLVILLAYIFHKQSISLDNVHLRDDLWYLLISCMFILFSALDGLFQWYEGLILIGIYIFYIIHQFFESRLFDIVPEDDAVYMADIAKRQWLISGILLSVGAILLLLVAHPFVVAIEELSLAMGLSALILALVISPFASEMPEKISAFVLTIRDIKGAEMAIANFIGSKVMNNSLLFGAMIVLAAVVYNNPLTDTTRDILILLVMVLTTVIGVKLTYDLKLRPKEGLLALILYVISVGVVFLIYNFF